MSSGDTTKVTITVKSKNPVDNTETSSTCKLTVNSTGGSSTSIGGSCSCTRNEFIENKLVSKCVNEMCKYHPKYGEVCYCISYDWITKPIYEDVTRVGTKIIYTSRLENPVGSGNYTCNKISYCKNSVYSCNFITTPC